jgi:DNA-binding NtrC family response regulator
MRAGAFDYTTKNLEELDRAPLLLERALARQRERRELAFLRSELAKADREMVASDREPMTTLLATVARAAPTQSTVLLAGESGTGKEVMARRLHKLSPRASGPFVAVNVAAIPRDLVEGTLFGHERGAFTGAVAERIGEFELADGGTLFLDEIGELEKGLQAKVLRVIQERQLKRLGGTIPIELDIRLVAATHVDLGAAVARGDFREDLYYRLNVVPIRLPPLRERLADLPAMIGLFAGRHGARCRRNPLHFTPAALASLTAHSWPGNIRELENLVERLSVLCPRDVVEPGDLPAEYRVGELAAIEEAKPNGDALGAMCDAFERSMLAMALDRARGDRADVARALGVPYSTLTYKLTKYGLI